MATRSASRAVRLQSSSLPPHELSPSIVEMKQIFIAGRWPFHHSNSGQEPCQFQSDCLHSRPSARYIPERTGQPWLGGSGGYLVLHRPGGRLDWRKMQLKQLVKRVLRLTRST